MNRAIAWLIAAIVLLAMLVSAGPALVALANALVPLVIAAGVVAIALRLVFFHTRNW